jgi:ABC-2 type transport system permease protein
VRHLLLVWQLRLMTGANRYRRISGAAPALLGLLLLVGVAGAMGVGMYALLSHPVIAASPRWSRFLLRLATFLISVVFVVWPVLSAGVDEHTELTRFATFPIRPIELFVASSISGLFEARTVVFYPAIAGAVLGYAAQRPFPLLPGLALTAAYIVFCVAWGRAGLTLVLNVLRHRRSAEILGMVFLGGLFLATLAPPVDVSWLYDLFGRGAGFAGLADVDDKFVIATSKALGGLPPCALAVGIEALARGDGHRALIEFLVLSFFTLVGSALSFWLLVRFYKGTARPQKRRIDRVSEAGRARDGALWALLDREASDFLRNPKARLLCAVPFFLCILLRLVHARDLADAAFGPTADAWLLAVLCSYAALVVGANFAQNVFAYDGPGLALLFAAPVPARSLFLAKNAVHAGGALLVSLLLVAFYGVYVHPIGLAEAAVGVLAPLVELPVLLAVGNVLSVLAPRKFHASLRRRDRPPAMATFVGLAAAAAAVAPVGLLLRLAGEERPGVFALCCLMLVAAGLWSAWSRLLPWDCELLEARRETVLRLVMRE